MSRWQRGGGGTITLTQLLPVPSSWKRLRSLAKSLPHPLLRQRAHAALRRRLRPADLLVVCHGNICRSPFAAALLARPLVAMGIRVESAGFVGPDRPSPRDAVRVAEAWGVDLSTHRSRLLTPQRVRQAELIVVMDPAQGRAICERFGRSPRDILALGDMDPEPLVVRVIRDPVEQGPAAFAASYERIERCVAGLVGALASLPCADATTGDRNP